MSGWTKQGDALQLLIHGFSGTTLEKLQHLFLDLQLPPWKRITDDRLDIPLRQLLELSAAPESTPADHNKSPHVLLYHIKDPQWQLLRKVYQERELPEPRWVLLTEGNLDSTFQQLVAAIRHEEKLVGHYQSIRKSSV